MQKILFYFVSSDYNLWKYLWLKKAMKASADESEFPFLNLS